LRAAVDEVSARAVEVERGAREEQAAELREQLRSLGERLAQAESPGDLEERLRAAVDEVSARAVEVERGAREEQAAELREQLRSQAERLEQTGSSAELETLGAELRGAVEALGAELSADREQAAELREQLHSHAERLEPAGSSAELETLGAELRDAVEALGAELSADRERAEEAAARVERTIAEVREEQQRHDQGAAERETSSEVAVEAIGHLEDRLSALESRGGAEIEPALGDLREQLAGLSTRLDDSERHAAEAHAALGLALEGVDARLEDAALRSAEHAAAIEHAVRRELESLAATAEERDAAAIDARAEVREALERAVSSLGWRIEKVEDALAGDDRDELRELVSAFERRLDAQAAQSDELVRLTEKALRKGLASLGSRLSESEEAYVEAGNALRRSIERLGLAIDDANQRVAPDAEVSAPAGESYLAFAPVGDAYRLMELQGAAPEVGDAVVLPDGAAGLVVTRIGRSPLPFDARSCVYLERRQPVVAD
jgi:chromosome segregation ATPase